MGVMRCYHILFNIYIPPQTPAFEKGGACGKALPCLLRSGDNGDSGDDGYYGYNGELPIFPIFPTAEGWSHNVAQPPRAHRAPKKNKKARPTDVERALDSLAHGLFTRLLGFDALRSVRHTQQTLAWDKLSRGLAYAVGLIVDAHECHFEVAYELRLTLCQTAILLLRECCGTLLHNLECWR